MSRTALVELLDDLAAYPATAVVAPAGAGKTALAADWVRHCGRPFAWLAVDELDHDPARFCAAVIAAVEPLAPGCADRARSAVSGADGPLGALRVLTDDLELADSGDAVLVLDDLHHVDGGEHTTTVLAGFVEHKPEWLHLLLLSRRSLSIAVDRLRAAGWLADLGFDVLRFSECDALDLLSALCPGTAPAHLRTIADWSGGWAAALQLAALAVRSTPPAHLDIGEGATANPAAADRLVDSYLWHEVLRGEPAEQVELLLSTAVVDRMNYGLAEALTGRRDAGDLLLAAEERGLFVTRLDAGGWFEVHSLVRELLVAELERRAPERLREQHARAARWLESMADGVAAGEHWLDAGEPAEALRLLAAIATSRPEGVDPDAVNRIIERIPAAVSAEDADSSIRLAWSRLLVDRTGFLDALAEAKGAVTDPCTPVQAGHLGLLRSAECWLTGDWQACINLALAGLDHLGAGAVAEPVESFGWSLVTHGIALEERWSDNLGMVREGRAAVADHAERRLAHEGARALGLALAGQPLDSLRVAASVRRAAERVASRTLRAELDVAEAVAARELCDRERATPVLENLAARSAYPGSHVRLLALLELVELRLGDGDVATAGSLFRQAEDLVSRELSGPGGRSLLTRVGVLLALREEDLSAAEQWTRQVHDPFWRPICEAQLALAGGRHPDAAEALQCAEPRCARHHVVRGLLRARAISGAEHQAAVKSVEMAIECAADHGMLQTVASYGGALLELIELASWRVPSAWMDRLRRVLVPDPLRSHASPELIEELTSRERDVMRLLPSRLTLREIASELFVSQNTLKFHLRVIYRKLGVNSRAEAVESARRLRLLARG